MCHPRFERGRERGIEGGREWMVGFKKGSEVETVSIPEDMYVVPSLKKLREEKCRNGSFFFFDFLHFLGELYPQLLIL